MPLVRGIVAISLLRLLGGCAVTRVQSDVATMHPACDEYGVWNGHACTSVTAAAEKLDAGRKALAAFKVDDAKIALDAVASAGPLDYATHVGLWEQRGIAAAYVDDEANAATAFDMLLALDPGHYLSYLLSPKATFVFEKVRKQVKSRGEPAVDVNWEHGERVGEPVPIEVEVVADPKQFLRRATLFVRTRGDATWQATDVALAAKGEQHVVLPAITATKPVSLEIYLRAYDDQGNEVLTWADAARPREIPLRYDPPTPWYRKWWVIAIAGSAAAIATGVTVYELTLSPPDKINGSATVK